MFETLLRGLFWLALAFVSYNAFVSPDQVTAPRMGDVFLHSAAFIVLTGLLFGAYPGWANWRGALALLCYGALIELVQLYLPERSAELKDLGVDAVGIGLGVVVYRLLGARVLARLRPSD